MQTSIPSLPSLKFLPYNIAVDGAAGLLYGTIRQTRPALTMAIFATRSMANGLFYHMINYLVGGKDLLSQKIYLLSSSAINVIFLVALRELHLINRFFAGVVGTAIVGQLIYRVSYIQEKERELIKAKIG